jgi:hypothetical protein
MYLYRVTGGGGDTALRRGQAATETVRKRVGIRKAEQAEQRGFCLGDVTENGGVLDIAERIDVSVENPERDRDRPHQWSSLDESRGGRYHRSSRHARRCSPPLYVLPTVQPRESRPLLSLSLTMTESDAGGQASAWQSASLSERNSQCYRI